MISKQILLLTSPNKPWLLSEIGEQNTVLIFRLFVVPSDSAPIVSEFEFSLEKLGPPPASTSEFVLDSPLKPKTAVVEVATPLNS
jgi:hypothetical protein